MTKHPTRKAVSFDLIEANYKASMFRYALSHYVLKQQNPTYPYNEIENMISDFHLHFDAVSVYHKARFWLGDRETHQLQSNEYDVVHSRPARMEKDKEIPARFDTVLVNSGNGAYIGVKDHRIARVKVIFALSSSVIKATFPAHVQIPKYLAYVEWFSSFSSSPDNDNMLYKIQKVTYQDRPVASIIPLYNIVRSVHLFPKFPVPIPEDWSSTNILDECETFYVNSFSD